MFNTNRRPYHHIFTDVFTVEDTDDSAHYLDPDNSTNYRVFIRHIAVRQFVATHLALEVGKTYEGVFVRTINDDYYIANAHLHYERANLTTGYFTVEEVDDESDYHNSNDRYRYAVRFSTDGTRKWVAIDDNNLTVGTTYYGSLSATTAEDGRLHSFVVKLKPEPIEPELQESGDFVVTTVDEYCSFHSKEDNRRYRVKFKDSGELWWVSCADENLQVDDVRSGKLYTNATEDCKHSTLLVLDEPEPEREFYFRADLQVGTLGWQTNIWCDFTDADSASEWLELWKTKTRDGGAEVISAKVRQLKFDFHKSTKELQEAHDISPNTTKVTHKYLLWFETTTSIALATANDTTELLATVPNILSHATGRVQKIGVSLVSLH